MRVSLCPSPREGCSHSLCISLSLTRRRQPQLDPVIPPPGVGCVAPLSKRLRQATSTDPAVRAVDPGRRFRSTGERPPTALGGTAYLRRASGAQARGSREDRRARGLLRSCAGRPSRGKISGTGSPPRCACFSPPRFTRRLPRNTRRRRLPYPRSPASPGRKDREMISAIGE